MEVTVFASVFSFFNRRKIENPGIKEEDQVHYQSTGEEAT
jgi:hypothetical protein